MIDCMGHHRLVASIALACACSDPAPPQVSASSTKTGSAEVKHVEEALGSIIATCAEALGTIEVRRKGQAHWEPLAIGGTLRERDWVRTGKGSFVRIRFAGRGFVDLRENTTLLVDSALSIDSGAVAVVAEGDKPFEMTAKDGSKATIAAAPGSGPAEVRLVPGKDSALEVAVMKGSVAVTTDGGQQTVAAGHATDVANNRASGVVRLIAYPRSVAPGIDARFLFVEDKEIRLSWQPVKSAKGYLVQIARDPEFRELVTTAELAATHTAFVPTVAGQYAWRVAARDKNDRLGEYGFARRLFVEQEPPRDLLLSPAEGTKVGFSDAYPRIPFSWQSAGDTTRYKLRIWRSPGLETEPVLDLVTDKQEIEVATLREGDYRWGVYAIRKGREEPIYVTARVLTIGRHRVKAHTENLWDKPAR